MSDSPPIATRNAWKTEPCPEERAPLRLERSYTHVEFEAIARGLIPLEMEDKWFIFYEEPWLYVPVALVLRRSRLLNEQW